MRSNNKNFKIKNYNVIYLFKKKKNYRLNDSKRDADFDYNPNLKLLIINDETIFDYFWFNYKLSILINLLFILHLYKWAFFLSFFEYLE